MTDLLEARGYGSSQDVSRELELESKREKATEVKPHRHEFFGVTSPNRSTDKPYERDGGTRKDYERSRGLNHPHEHIDDASKARLADQVWHLVGIPSRSTSRVSRWLLAVRQAGWLRCGS